MDETSVCDNGTVLALLRQWESASDAGDRTAAEAIERAVIGALSPPDDGTGEARAAIGKTFVSALATGSEEAAQQILDKAREPLEQAIRVQEGSRDPDARAAVPVPAIRGEYPAPVLSLAGRSGSVVSEGSAGVLSGAGGVAKSATILHQGLAFAMASPADDGADCEPCTLHGGILDARRGGGRVLFLSHENEPQVVRQSPPGTRLPNRWRQCWGSARGAGTSARYADDGPTAVRADGPRRNSGPVQRSTGSPAWLGRSRSRGRVRASSAGDHRSGAGRVRGGLKQCRTSARVPRCPRQPCRGPSPGGPPRRAFDKGGAQGKGRSDGSGTSWWYRALVRRCSWSACAEPRRGNAWRSRSDVGVPEGQP